MKIKMKWYGDDISDGGNDGSEGKGLYITSIKPARQRR